MSRRGVRLVGRHTLRPGWVLSNPGPTREETLKAVAKHLDKQEGFRQGWQAKTGNWIKKGHFSRGHIEVGSFKGGKYEINPSFKPHYIVPDLSNTALKPYVAHYDPAMVKELMAATEQVRPSSRLRWPSHPAPLLAVCVQM